MNAAQTYYEMMKTMLEQAFFGQAEQMEKAAQKIAACVTGGGMVYTFGTGHGHLLALEVFYRAG